jgi:adenylate kinase family enzyme
MQQIMIVGPPGSGKTTLALALARTLGLAVCSVAAEASARAEAGDAKVVKNS